MNQSSRQQHSAWSEHFQLQRESGLTHKAYCEDSKLNYHQFGYWKRKLKGENKTQSASRDASSKFVPVNIAMSPSQAELSISLSTGIVLSGITENNHSLAVQMIRALT